MSVCVAKYHDQLISIRRHLHTMPERIIFLLRLINLL